MTLDGGGIRGYSSLLILEALMHEIWIWEQRLDVVDEEDGQRQAGDQGVQDGGQTAGETLADATTENELLPCHYFDFMYGTSTGGLIATMLGRLRMTIPECLQLYRKVGEDLFGKQRSRVPLTTKYYHKPLERAVQEIVASRCHEHPNCSGKDDLHPWTLYDDTETTVRIMTPVTPPETTQKCSPRSDHRRQMQWLDACIVWRCV